MKHVSFVNGEHSMRERRLVAFAEQPQQSTTEDRLNNAEAANAKLQEEVQELRALLEKSPYQAAHGIAIPRCAECQHQPGFPVRGTDYDNMPSGLNNSRSAHNPEINRQLRVPCEGYYIPNAVRSRYSNVARSARLAAHYRPYQRVRPQPMQGQERTRYARGIGMYREVFDGRQWVGTGEVRTIDQVRANIRTTNRQNWAENREYLRKKYPDVLYRRLGTTGRGHQYFNDRNLAKGMFNLDLDRRFSADNPLNQIQNSPSRFSRYPNTGWYIPAEPVSPWVPIERFTPPPAYIMPRSTMPNVYARVGEVMSLMGNIRLNKMQIGEINKVYNEQKARIPGPIKNALQVEENDGNILIRKKVRNSWFITQLQRNGD